MTLIRETGDLAPGRFPDLATRSATAAAAGTLAGGALYAGGWPWLAFVVVATLLGLREMVFLARRGAGGPFLPVCSVFSAVLLVSAMSAVELRNTAHGTISLLLCLAAVLSGDVGAYLGGRILGGVRFVPRVSPSKTWSGAVCGVVLGVSAAVLAGRGLGVAAPHVAPQAVASVLAGQLGDLVESWLKREADVRDSGGLLPGHGGVLDRLDSVSFAILGTVLALLWDSV